MYSPCPDSSREEIKGENEHGEENDMEKLDEQIVNEPTGEDIPIVTLADQEKLGENIPIVILADQEKLGEDIPHIIQPDQEQQDQDAGGANQTNEEAEKFGMFFFLSLFIDPPESFCDS